MNLKRNLKRLKEKHKFHIEYSSNNSGGVWWLKDSDWTNLEDAGWRVHWKKDDPNPILGIEEDGRWLGTLATSACKDFEASSEEFAIEDAEREFSYITGQDTGESGCECCGPPHDLYSFNSCIHEYYYPKKEAT